MRASLIIVLMLALLVPPATQAQGGVSAEREWRTFFSAFRAAVKKRDREVLKKMLARDIFFSGGGDDNGDGDTRDEAFQLWDDPHVRGWEAFDKILSQGTVPKAAWWDGGRRRRHVSRVSPPAANIRRNVRREAIDWYAIFEFRDGRWYCTIFNQCCD